MFECLTRKFSAQFAEHLTLSKYELRYLPLFWEDMFDAVSYITNVLHNEQAAKKLVDDAETKINEHLKNPTCALIYNSLKERDNTYYWFEVRNYMVFYVVIDNIMEVRRFIYGARDLTKINL